MEYTKNKLPVNFGMNALALFSADRGISMNEVFTMDFDKMNLLDTLSLLYSGVVDGARKAKVECKFSTLEDFIDYAEENDGIVAELITIFANQQKGKKGEESKKK